MIPDEVERAGADEAIPALTRPCIQHALRASDAPLHPACSASSMLRIQHALRAVLDADAAAEEEELDEEELEEEQLEICLEFLDFLDLQQDGTRGYFD